MVELNPKYKQILTTDKRYVIITGGRGSGKSFAISTIANLITYEKKNRILYSRYTLVSAEISIIPEFEEKLELLKVEKDFQVRKNQIENLQTGSDILFRGIKSSSGNLTANLKSLKGVSVWIVEEAEELVEEDIFDKVDYSIRSAHARNLVVLILNPTTIEHWIWKRFFEKSMKYEYVDGYKVPISTHPEVLHIHTTYMDNLDNLSPSFLNQVDRLREDHPDKYHKVMLGGWRENDEGAVFKNWVEGHFDNNLPYCYGLDFGYYPDPLAFIKVAVDHKNKKIYLQEKIYETELSNDEIKRKVTRSIDRMTDLIACDHDKKTVAELKSHGLNVKLAKKGKVKEEITALQDYHLVVDYNSNEIKRELRLYHWNDKKSSIPIDDYNHLMDAMRYAFNELSKRRKLGLKFFN